MLDVMSSDFIRTARAKGLSERTVLFKHAFKNAVLPIITIFSSVFPMAVGGSVIIESIFDYEGMGNALYFAVINNDYPVVISFFCMAGLLTMLAFLLSDILYKLVDPRISLKEYDGILRTYLNSHMHYRCNACSAWLIAIKTPC